LESVIKEYVKSAEPVSSGLLEKKYNFDISPAMIRIEMEKLTGAGYLSQPFVSSGRVPTDKGYRYFVDKLLKEKKPKVKESKELKSLLNEEGDDFLGFGQSFAKMLSKMSSMMAIVSFPEEERLFKEGWENIFRMPEFADRETVFGLADLIGEMEKNIDDIYDDSLENNHSQAGITIYIGEETPFGKVKGFSIISSSCCFPKKKKGMISLVGPKRMAYERNIEILNSFSEIMEEQANNGQKK
jgi:transcriptional regulator of heat shock response